MSLSLIPSISQITHQEPSISSLFSTPGNTCPCSWSSSMSSVDGMMLSPTSTACSLTGINSEDPLPTWLLTSSGKPLELMVLVLHSGHPGLTFWSQHLPPGHQTGKRLDLDSLSSSPSLSSSRMDKRSSVLSHSTEQIPTQIEVKWCNLNQNFGLRKKEKQTQFKLHERLELKSKQINQVRCGTQINTPLKQYRWHTFSVFFLDPRMSTLSTRLQRPYLDSWECSDFSVRCLRGLQCYDSSTHSAGQ